MTGEILAIIPVSGQDPEFRRGIPALGGRPLLDYTFEAVRASRLIRRVVVSTDSRAIGQECRNAGFEVPFIRPRGSRRLPIGHVLRAIVDHLERREPTYRPSWIVQLHVTFPFRESGFIDRAIRTVLSQDLDSAVAVFPEYASFWALGPDGEPRRFATDVLVPRARRTPIYRELGGLFSMISREVLASGAVQGARVGIIPTRFAASQIDVHGTHGLELARQVALVLAKRTGGRRVRKVSR